MRPSVLITMIVLAVLIFGGAALLSRRLVRNRAAPSADFSAAPTAQGTITGRENTRRAINWAYLWILTLDVLTPDGQRFTATARTRIVQGFEKSMLLPGTTVPVRYRPDQPGTVEVVFDQGDIRRGRSAWADTGSQRSR